MDEKFLEIKNFTERGERRGRGGRELRCQNRNFLENSTGSCSGLTYATWTQQLKYCTSTYFTGKCNSKKVSQRGKAFYCMCSTSMRIAALEAVVVGYSFWSASLKNDAFSTINCITEAVLDISYGTFVVFRRGVHLHFFSRVITCEWVGGCGIPAAILCSSDPRRGKARVR